ncbi:MlaD family protein [Spirochaetota bacterium]
MKSNIKFELLVGVVFLAAMAILGFYTIFMVQKISEPEKVYYITVKFLNAEGLEKKSEVKVNGVRSGVVEYVKLKEDHVEARLRMFTHFSMYDNYKISIATISLLGRAQVSIFPGSKIDKRGRSRQIITTRENLNGILDNPLMSISDIINDNRENVYATIKNMREFTEKINKGKGTIGRLVNENTIHDSANALVKDLRESIEDAREQAPVTSFIRAALTMF